MLKRIGKYYSHLCFGLASLMADTYIFFHLNYLDSPEVTPLPPRLKSQLKQSKDCFFFFICKTFL